MYGVYDMKNKEPCVGIFKTAKEIAEYFDTSVNVIRSGYITRKHLRDCRYKIVKLERVE